jgi:hypothetical protein
MKKTLLLSLVVIFTLAACKKDKANEVAEISLKGKWTVQSTLIKHFNNNVLGDSYTIPGNGAIFDFQTNGTVVMTHDGVVESHPYSIQPGSKVDIDGDVNEIRNLTASSVTLYFRAEYSSTEYVEFFQGLTR